MSAPRRALSRDVLLAVLLFAAIVAYLVYLPRTLGRADESFFLYEAKRIRDGDVIYRDFFQFVTPGAPYIMALLFWLFGTTIQTARVATAVLHASTGVVMFATGRALSIRPALAVILPIAYLAICQPAWQFASWHWFSTFFTVLVMYTLVRGPWASRPRWAIVPGLATGMLIGVQQQKGAAITAGGCLIFLLAHLIEYRYPDRESWRRLVVRLSSYAVGIAIIVVPLLASFILIAGWQPVYDALVVFPLVNYRNSFRTTWGAVFWITQGYAARTFPTLLQFLPVATVPAVLRIAGGLVTRADREQLRKLIVVVVSAGSAALSIWYFPDMIHIAFVAPVFLIAAAEAVEWALTVAVRSPRVSLGIEAVVSAGLLIALALHLRSNAIVWKEQFRYPTDTAFGRVDFPMRWPGVLIDHTRALLAETANNELFAYPNTCEPYLTTGGKNPTPYQYFYAPVSPKQHTDNVLALLTSGKVQYIMAQGFFLRRNDPVARIILDDYERVKIPGLAGLEEFPTLSLYRRRDSVSAGADAATH